MNCGSRIAGVGAYLPRTVVPNEFFADIMARRYTDQDDFFDGMSERRHSASDETSVFMGTMAAREALHGAGVSASEIDYVLTYSMGSDFVFPPDGTFVMQELGIRNASHMTLDAVCATFIPMLAHGEFLIRSGRAHRVLIVTMCNWVNRQVDKTRNYASIGDGAGAVVLVPASEPSLHSFHERTFPEWTRAISIEAPKTSGSVPLMEFAPATDAFREFMLGGIVLECARKCLLECRQKGIRPKWAIFGQPGLRAMKVWLEGLELPEESLLSTIRFTGNLGTANHPVVLHHFLNADPRIQRGDDLLLFAPGAGMSTPALVWRY